MTRSVMPSIRSNALVTSDVLIRAGAHMSATVCALQLCNECHTWDYYEESRGMVPGELLYNWEVLDEP